MDDRTGCNTECGPSGQHKKLQQAIYSPDSLVGGSQSALQRNKADHACVEICTVVDLCARTFHYCIFHSHKIPHSHRVLVGKDDECHFMSVSVSPAVVIDSGCRLQLCFS